MENDFWGESACWISFTHDEVETISKINFEIRWGKWSIWRIDLEVPHAYLSSDGISLILVNAANEKWLDVHEEHMVEEFTTHLDFACWGSIKKWRVWIVHLVVKLDWRQLGIQKNTHVQSFCR